MAYYKSTALDSLVLKKIWIIGLGQFGLHAV